MKVLFSDDSEERGGRNYIRETIRIKVADGEIAEGKDEPYIQIAPGVTLFFGVDLEDNLVELTILNAPR